MEFVVVVGIWKWFLFVLANLPFLLAFQSKVPAFLWSPHLLHNQLPNNKMNEAVNYQTISSKDLGKTVLSEGGWSNLLCSEEKLQQPLDLALVFVGRELLSSDISANKNANLALVNLLKVSFRRSNFSVAFPYVTTSEEENMANSLFLGFAETCGQDLAVGSVAFSESCSEYLASRREKVSNGPADLIFFCVGGADSQKGFDYIHSESEIFSELITYVEMLRTKYSVLYISDPSQSICYPSRQLVRLLAEDSRGNGSLNSTVCDEVCQIKSSLLEGVLVGIVLLIILISGLCCMMGIDTPTRFEAPQDC
ncbi:hypothetical protein K2173_010860 [Erythroxylum novogranatense]|uniref:V-type proton ATPase subunit S1/VOA1 transmembrane domain-containing protein n=1 Tax=Erythroxylum novogranatense TaxID=1862640 RepID=A0AAV8T1L8_9ROSI|nr:hypothetical protein K2173_010860 [Erythroxylum novogranatense]